MAILGAAGPSAYWYTTRATGLVSLVLLTASVVLGVLGSVRWSSSRWPRLLTQGLHRNVSLLVVAFVAIHVATSVLDGYAPIGWLAWVVPFTSRYHPIWLGLGAVSFDLILAVIATSLLRTKLSLRVWRAVHWTAYACWPVALAHSLGAGTDTRLSWVLAVELSCLMAVAGAVAWRIGQVWRHKVGRLDWSGSVDLGSIGQSARAEKDGAVR